MTITDETTASVRDKLGTRNLVVVGLMGAGKTVIGRRLAQQLDLPFVDADSEIEKAAGQTIEEIFDTYGERHFRAGERKVIERLLLEGPRVVATGGGAFMSPETREIIAKTGVSIWLKADLDLLVKRVGRRSTRPLLKSGNAKNIMRRLMTQRYPVYQKADFVIQSRDVRHGVIVQEIVDALDGKDGL